FGVGSAALAGQILSRRGRPHAIAAMILVSVSYPLIVYSSEARGYAPMVFFVLMAVSAHERVLRSRTWPALIAFWTAAILGMLSHLTFLHAYVAIVLWSVYAMLVRARCTTGALAD